MAKENQQASEDKAPQAPWDHLIKNSGGATTTDTYKAHEAAIATSDYDTAGKLYDQACRDAT